MAQPVPPPMAAPIGTDNPNVNKAPQRLSTNKMAARCCKASMVVLTVPRISFMLFLTVFVLLVLPKIQPKIAEGENMREHERTASWLLPTSNIYRGLHPEMSRAAGKAPRLPRAVPMAAPLAKPVAPPEAPSAAAPVTAPAAVA